MRNNKAFTLLVELFVVIGIIVLPGILHGHRYSLSLRPQVVV
jgi:hypothetical protein